MTACYRITKRLIIEEVIGTIFDDLLGNEAGGCRVFFFFFFFCGVGWGGDARQLFPISRQSHAAKLTRRLSRSYFHYFCPPLHPTRCIYRPQQERKEMHPITGSSQFVRSFQRSSSGCAPPLGLFPSSSFSLCLSFSRVRKRPDAGTCGSDYSCWIFSLFECVLFRSTVHQSGRALSLAWPLIPAVFMNSNVWQPFLAHGLPNQCNLCTYSRSGRRTALQKSLSCAFSASLCFTLTHIMSYFLSFRSLVQPCRTVQSIQLTLGKMCLQCGAANHISSLLFMTPASPA